MSRPTANWAMRWKGRGNSMKQSHCIAKPSDKGQTFPLGYNYLGSLLAQQHRIDEAAGLFRKAVEVGPDYENALCNLGAALTSQGKPKEAVSILQKAVALNPSDPSARVNFGNALIDLKQVAQAREQFEEALRLSPDLLPAKYGLTDCLKTAGETK
jgi:Flp pilus assembly protein TadD